MAIAANDRNALVALHRFGLGARGGGAGDLRSAAMDPRGYLAAELVRPGVALLDAPGMKPEDFKSLRFCISGGAPLPAQLKEEWERITGARVIDLFAGSGALGFEALSRGAVFALFVETDEAARGAVRDNMEELGLFGAARVHRRDAADLGLRPASAGPAFDLAFLDPPYAKGLGEAALKGLADGAWLAPGAIVVFERGADEPPLAVAGFELLDARTYGAARVNFLKAAG